MKIQFDHDAKRLFMLILLIISLATVGGFVNMFAAQAAGAAPPDDAHLKAASDYNFATAGQCFLVMYDGKVIAEEYGNGGSAEGRHMLASGSKSFAGITAAAAVQDGIINFDDPACQAIIEWRNDPVKSKITYRQLLSLTSGLTPAERGYAVRGPAWPAIAAKPMISAPGQKFAYGAYQINTFAYALERKLGKETWEAYLKRRILDPISVKVDWRFRCDDGHPQVGGGAFMTARDWATFGEMIRNRGRLGDNNLLDPRVLEECFKGSPQNPAYGLSWWLKVPVSESINESIPILERDWGAVANARGLPGDLVAACGAGKQRLFVIPSRKLVIVRQAKFNPGGAAGDDGRASPGSGGAGGRAGAFAARRRTTAIGGLGQNSSYSDAEFLKQLLSP